jgi:hypothetical protein
VFKDAPNVLDWIGKLIGNGQEGCAARDGITGHLRTLNAWKRGSKLRASNLIVVTSPPLKSSAVFLTLFVVQPLYQIDPSLGQRFLGGGIPMSQ